MAVEIAVHDPRDRRGGPIGGQPFGDLVDAGQLPLAIRLELPPPAVDLTLEEPLRSPQVRYPRHLVVDGRQGAECVEHLFGDPPRRRRSAQLDGDRFAGNEAVDELHDVEDRSRHVDIGAQGDRLGVGHTGAGQRPLEPELTLHDPVGTVDRQRHRRRPPQHPSLIAPVRHEHLVGLAHGDALEAQVRAPAQVGRVEPVTQ